MVLSEVVERLNEEFSGAFPPDTIEAVVEGTAAEWRDAPIQDYVPLLTERAARTRLRGDMAALRWGKQ